jgi:hypothetical protein
LLNELPKAKTADDYEALRPWNLGPAAKCPPLLPGSKHPAVACLAVNDQPLRQLRNAV